MDFDKIQISARDGLTNTIPKNADGFPIVPINPMADYSYGLKNNTIDANVALRNFTAPTPKIAIGNFNITGTGNISITGLGFQPKHIEFQAGNNTGNIFSVGVTYGPGIDSCYGYQQGTGQFTTNGYCIFYSSTTFGFKTQANLVSFDATGFTINVSLYFGTPTPIYFKASA